MIYDIRTYSCRPGTLSKYIELYLESGYKVQSEHLGAPVLIGTTEIGNVNAYTHIWAYDNLSDREIRRAAMRNDPRWQEFLRLAEASGYLESQQNVIVNGVSLPAIGAV